jgi:hypothetical protein
MMCCRYFGAPVPYMPLPRRLPSLFRITRPMITSGLLSPSRSAIAGAAMML